MVKELSLFYIVLAILICTTIAIRRWIDKKRRRIYPSHKNYWLGEDQGKRYGKRNKF